MQRPRIFVVNDQDIARVLACERDLPVKHITRTRERYEAERDGLVIVMNRAGAHRTGRNDLNPVSALARYHALVERVLHRGFSAPRRPWQPATLIDCRIEQSDFTLSSMCDQITRQFIEMLHSKWKQELDTADTLKDAFSHTLGLHQLVAVVRERFLQKLAHEELAPKNRASLSYYDHEPYVDHLL